MQIIFALLALQFSLRVFTIARGEIQRHHFSSEQGFRGRFIVAVILMAGGGWLALGAESALAAVVLDADLPGMDGFEICLRLRANPFTNWLPILFLSGNANAPLKALASGADKVLSKPEGISELVPALRELLNR